MAGAVGATMLGAVCATVCGANQRSCGDEFAILLLDSNGELAHTVSDRIRTCLRAQTETPTLSVSIGASVYPEDGASAADLLEAADRRLYSDKKSRRERAGEAQPASRSEKTKA